MNSVKRFLSTILIILYCTTITGATIQMHYCMGDLVEINFFHNEDEPCSNCGMDKEKGEKSGCCNNKNEFVKSDHSQLAGEASFTLLKTFSQALPVFFLDKPDYFSSVTEENPMANAPPRKPDIPIFKRNCVYII